MTIVKYPADILRQIAAPVEVVDESLKDLCGDMVEACKDSNGLAVAAPQVGVSLSVFVCPHGPDGGIYINPRILSYSDDLFMFGEGCLSIPDKYWYISRPNRVTMEYQTINGVTAWWTEDQVMGRMMQHEVDHLNGKLVIDLLTKYERKQFDREFPS